jgi:antitoxin HicB
MTDPAQYPVDIFYSDEDEGFIALASDLPGCSAFGETRADAANEIQDAICAWIKAADKAGNPIPEPSKRGADSLPSGKILLRLPRTLHGQLIEQAQREGTSLNQFLLYVITSNTSAQVVASAVVDKLVATASHSRLTLSDRISNVTAGHAQYYAGQSRVVVADAVDKFDVVMYGTIAHPVTVTGYSEKVFGPQKLHRVRTHG